MAERTLLGKEAEITEQQIGVHVFGRPTGYNPGEDNIVRQSARQLRQRLALFYQEEGRDERIQVLIPKGAYITLFQLSAAPKLLDVAPAELPGPLDKESLSHLEGSSPAERPGLFDAESIRHKSLELVQRRPSLRSLTVIFTFLLGASSTLIGNLAWQRLRHPTTSSNKVWHALFASNQKTLVVVGDAGLNMYSNLGQREIGIEDYAKQDYVRTPEAAAPPGATWAPFAIRKYIALTDLTFVTRLQSVADKEGNQLDIRFARDIHFNDLGNSPAILIGGPNYNPWVHAFDRNIDLQMIYDGAKNSLNVVNRAPKPGEMAMYTESPLDPSRTGYALISLTDNVQGTGRVLLVEGTGMGGVETATDFLFNPTLMNPIVREAELGHGGIANFDLLLKTTFFTGGNLRAEVVAFHIHPPILLKTNESSPQKR